MRSELRQEQASLAWRNSIFEAKGKRCVVCGATEHLQIHHVQALANGGTNDINNLIIVCEKHHAQLHNKIYKNTANSGCKPKASYEEALPTLERYFNMEIGRAECAISLGYSPLTHSASISKYIKRYKKENNIPDSFYNNIDLRVSKGWNPEAKPPEPKPIKTFNKCDREWQMIQIPSY